MRQNVCYLPSPPPLTLRAEASLIGDDLIMSIRQWLSPPDPSMNHDAAYGAHHRGTTSWFIRSNTFSEWKATGSLLWIHGIRTNILSFGFVSTIADILVYVAGSGKSVLWYVNCSSNSAIPPVGTHVANQLLNHPRHRSHVQSRTSHHGVFLF